MSKPKQFYFNCHPYDASISVFCFYSEKTLLPVIKNKLKLTASEEIKIKKAVVNSDALCYTTKDNYTFIVLNKQVINMPVSKVVKIVAHESLHATFDLLIDRGIKPSRETEEAYAYLHGHIVEQLLKGIGIK